MGIEILGGILAALLGGSLSFLKSIIEASLKDAVIRGRTTKTQEVLAKLFDVRIEDPKSYKTRLSETLNLLNTAFAEVERATGEFTALMKEKESSIDLLESRLSELTVEESQLKSKVATLQQVPLEAISHFEAILDKGEKRSALRDYKLFGLGVIVSVVITIILKRYFGI